MISMTVDTEIKCLREYLQSKSECIASIYYMNAPQQAVGSNDCALYCIEFLNSFLHNIPDDLTDFLTYSSNPFEISRMFSRENIRSLIWYLSVLKKPITKRMILNASVARSDHSSSRMHKGIKSKTKHSPPNNKRSKRFKAKQ